MRLGFAYVVLAGCSYVPGTGRVDARIDEAAIDAPPDTAIDSTFETTCYDQWLANTIRFDTPVPITEVNSAGYDRDPFLTDDELTVYVASGRGGQGDVWIAKRLSVSGTFSTPVEASEFNSTSSESKLSMSADRKVAVVGSDRPGSTGLDVWESIRLSVTDPWPAMNRNNVMMVETAGNEHDPTLSANAQHLYLAPDNPAPQHLAMATRAGNGIFGPAVELTELNSGTGDADPSPTSDERILTFASNRTLDGAGGGDVWYATRAMGSGPFNAPLPVPDINTTAAEGDPHVSANGCRIYFSRHLGNDNWDIFVATAQ
ncbi:MAG TPA: hypothetical protein VIV11_07355 [Kofleriaceae bacterium]